MYKLSDHVIARIMDVLQLSMLTGTDITDLFRIIRFDTDFNTGEIVLPPDANEAFKEMMTKMADELVKIMQCETTPQDLKGETSNDGYEN